MLVVTALDRDPRVERGARTLAAHGFDVVIICPVWRAEPRAIAAMMHWGSGISFRILPNGVARFAFYFPYVFGFRMLRAAVREAGWAYHAHDLTTSLIGLIAAAKTRAACVCDFHEWYSENVTYQKRLQTYKPHPFLKRRLFQAIERLALHTATEVITVSESIGASLQERYGAPKRVRIIRNIPFVPQSDTAVQPHTDLRAALGIPADQLIVLYQGGLGPSRNLEPVILALASVPKAVLVIRGPEHEVYGPAYRALAQRLGIGKQVYCLEPVPSARVVEEARAGDIGVWTLLANVGLNFYLALGNKIFEYLAAGLPLLVADLPEARKLVEQYQVGVCFDPDSPASIAAALTRMVEDHCFRVACQANIPLALHALRADEEWDKLVRLYRELLAFQEP
jgi:glycosyltransferase involved in cell wall biosynthesis